MNRARTSDTHALDFLLPACIAWLCIGGSLCNSLITLDFDACWGLVTSKVVFPKDCLNMQAPGIRDAVWTRWIISRFYFLHKENNFE
jgi:hypothetical protein